MPLAWKIWGASAFLALALPSAALASDEEMNLPDHQFSNPLFGPSQSEGESEDNRGGFIGSGRTSVGRAAESASGDNGESGSEPAAQAAQLPRDERGYLMAPALFRRANEVFKQMVPPSVRVGGPIQSGVVANKTGGAPSLFSGIPLAAAGALRPADISSQEGGGVLQALRAPAAEAPNIGTRLASDPHMSRVMSELKSSDDVVSQRQEAIRREHQLRQAVSRGAMKGAAVGAFRLMDSVKR